MTSNRKSDSISRYTFTGTWRTFLPNSIPIRFEMPEAFLNRSPKQQEEQQDEIGYIVATLWYHCDISSWSKYK